MKLRDEGFLFLFVVFLLFVLIIVPNVSSKIPQNKVGIFVQTVKDTYSVGDKIELTKDVFNIPIVDQIRDHARPNPIEEGTSPIGGTIISTEIRDSRRPTEGSLAPSKVEPAISINEPLVKIQTSSQKPPRFGGKILDSFQKIFSPSGRVIDSENSFNFQEEEFMEYLSEESFDGYFIEFESDSLLVKKNKLNSLAQENALSISKGISSKNTNTILPENVNTNLKVYSQELNTINNRVVSLVLSKLNSTKGKAGLSFEEYNLAFNGLYLNISKEEAEEMEKIKGVKSVYPNYRVYGLLKESVSLTKADKVWKLGTGCDNLNDNCLTGKGVKIGIIDTGIDYTHPAFGSCTRDQFLSGHCEKVIGGYDFLKNTKDVQDYNGHGTHCASIAAGIGNIKGTAPGASLYSLRVLGANGVGDSKNIIRAIEYSIDLDQDGIPFENEADYLDILSMSLGSSEIDFNSPIVKVLNEVVDSGMIVVVAAGNDGKGGESTINTPGIVQNVITVGSDNKDGDISYFSSVGPVYFEDEKGNKNFIPKPDINAPGLYICAARFGNAFEKNICDGDNYVSLSGTSMATPHVAGIAALLKQKNPSWNPNEIKMVLKQTAKIDKDNILKRGAGSVNALNAVQTYGKDIYLISDISSIKVSPSGNVDVYGTAKGEGYGYNLYLKEVGQSGKKICSGKAEIQDGLICSFDTPLFGRYELRLILSKYWFSKKEFSYGYFEYGEEIKLTHPLEDVAVGGNNFIVKGIVGGEGYVSHSIQYKLKGEGTWKSNFVTLEKYPINSELAERNLGSIDLSNFGEVEYELKLIVNYKNKNYNSYIERTVNFFVDKSLKEGWGISVKKGEYILPFISNIDKDHEKEIVVFYPGENSSLNVYGSDGGLKWQKELPFSQFNIIPTFGDVDKDGLNEIVLYLYSLKKLYIFNENGAFVSYDVDLSFDGPVGTTANMLPTIVVFDFDGDGYGDIVLKDNAFYNQKIFVFSKGKIVKDWIVDEGFRVLRSSGLTYPIVGNFDNDTEYEFAVIYSKLDKFTLKLNIAIYVYNLDGTIVNGWPKYFDGRIFSDGISGDVNNDGYDELIFNFVDSGIFVLDKAGEILWNDKQYVEVFNSPSLLDIEEDGYLEILVSNDPRGLIDNIYIFDYQGNLIKNILLNEIPVIRQVVVGNSNSNKLDKEILFSTHREIVSLSLDGKLVNEFPLSKDRTNFYPVLTDLENDGKVDVVVGSKSAIYTFELSAQSNFDISDWPMLQHDVGRTGNYGLNKEEAAPIIRDDSIIFNFDSVRVKGDLIMNLEKNIDGIWNKELEVVNVKDLRLDVNGNINLALNDNFGWNSKNVSVNNEGLYRVRANYHYKEYSSSFLMRIFSRYENIESTYEFVVSNVKPVAQVNEIQNVVPLLEDTKIENVAIWSKWFDIDNPSGKGDYELLENKFISQYVCNVPVGIECMTVNGAIGYGASGENVAIDLERGCWCINSEQSDGKCDNDYQVRFLCKE